MSLFFFPWTDSSEVRMFQDCMLYFSARRERVIYQLLRVLIRPNLSRSLLLSGHLLLQAFCSLDKIISTSFSALRQHLRLHLVLPSDMIRVIVWSVTVAAFHTLIHFGRYIRLIGRESNTMNVSFEAIRPCFIHNQIMAVVPEFFIKAAAITVWDWELCSMWCWLLLHIPASFDKTRQRRESADTEGGGWHVGSFWVFLVSMWSQREALTEMWQIPALSKTKKNGRLSHIVICQVR